MDELPHKLKSELAMVIHRQMYSHVAFFQDKDKSLITWVSRLIRPINYEDQDYIYKEGEEIFESKPLYYHSLVYFMVRGEAHYVLPRFENKPYFEINKGEHFGHVDLGEETDFLSEVTTGKLNTLSKDMLVRRFTVLANGDCELLTLSLKDLLKMKIEFPSAFQDLFKDARSLLSTHLLLKLEALKKSEMGVVKLNHAEDGEKLKSMVTSHFIGGMQNQLLRRKTEAAIFGKLGGGLKGASPQSFSMKSILQGPAGFKQRIEGNSTSSSIEAAKKRYMPNMEGKSLASKQISMNTRTSHSLDEGSEDYNSEVDIQVKEDSNESASSDDES